MSEFLVTDTPLQMVANGSGHDLITVPYRNEDGRFVALRVEHPGSDDGETIVLTTRDAIRLAKRLLCGADGNGDATSVFSWEGDLKDRLFSCEGRSEDQAAERAAPNPFANADGVGSVDVAGRLEMVRRFDLEECLNGLAVPNLQKTVEKRLRSRMRKLMEEPRHG